MAWPTGVSHGSTGISWERLLQQARGILPELILDALERGGVPSSSARLTGTDSTSTSRLLNVLIYAYAVGNFATAEILMDWNAGRFQPAMLADPVPDVSSVVSFRRRYRPLLKTCLTHLLVLVWAHPPPRPDPFEGNPRALWEQADAEAQRRLEWAQFVDLLDRE